MPITDYCGVGWCLRWQSDRGEYFDKICERESPIRFSMKITTHLEFSGLGRDRYVSALGPLGFNFSQHGSTTRPSVERTAEKAFMLSDRV